MTTTPTTRGLVLLVLVTAALLLPAVWRACRGPVWIDLERYP